jgi:hypothetical protein
VNGFIHAVGSGAKRTQTAAIQGAIVNVAKAMSGAGYSSSQYTIVVQDYPSPIPDSAGFRYMQAKDERQLVGGCTGAAAERRAERAAREPHRLTVLGVCRKPRSC